MHLFASSNAEAAGEIDAFVEDECAPCFWFVCCRPGATSSAAAGVYHGGLCAGGEVHVVQREPAGVPPGGGAGVAAGRQGVVSGHRRAGGELRPDRSGEGHEGARVRPGEDGERLEGPEWARLRSVRFANFEFHACQWRPDGLDHGGGAQDHVRSCRRGCLHFGGCIRADGAGRTTTATRGRRGRGDIPGWQVGSVYPRLESLAARGGDGQGDATDVGWREGLRVCDG